MAIQEGKVYRAVIDGYASDGAGVARIEGMAVFVKGAVRGETADVFIEHIGHNAAWGRIEKLIEASPARVEPDCPYYGACGGCQFRHMTYEEETESKRQRVEDALRRVGGVDLPVEVIHGARSTVRYRNKVQFPVGGGAIGYYRGRTHSVIDIDDCLLQPEEDTACLHAVKEWMTRANVPAYNEKTGRGLLRHLYLRTNSAGEVLCCLVINGRSIPRPELLIDLLQQAAPQLVGVVLSVNTRKTNVILGNEFIPLWGNERLEETLCGHTFRLSVPSFFQINRDQTEILYGRAVDFAQLTGEETVVELYCGIGTISLALAEKAKQVIGVEIVPQAIEDAKENAERNGLAHKTRFECGDASDLAARLEREGIRPDVVVVDPPRKGLAPDVVDTIARMAPQRVVYVSCDPATLARDVARFKPLGYTAVRAETVDLFPRTAHIESVVLLQRQSTAHRMKLHAAPFEMIKSGEKTIELRLFDEKRQQIKPGDTITFTNSANGEILNKTVKKLHRFDSFEALYQALPLLKCGYTSEDIGAAHPSDMEQYYSAEEQSKYGVIGIELCHSSGLQATGCDGN